MNIYYSLFFDFTAWDNGKTYHYKLKGRSLSGIHQLANQYTGVLLRGNVEITKKSDNAISLMVSLLC